MSKMGMIIGGHSVTHTLMTGAALTKQKMKFNKVEFFEKFKKNFIFCYPYGGPLSYNNKIIKLLKKYKFDLSISV